jgi:gluconate 2-dehydrogenase gamma chain
MLKIGLGRRAMLKLAASVAVVGLAGRSVFARLIEIFPQNTALTPDAVPNPGKGGFLTADETRIVGAIFDRLIPADDLSPGATELGCVEFLDRQLAGDYGNAAAMYRSGPFAEGTPQQGWQGRATPAERYRAGLAAVDRYARDRHNRPFADLPAERQDALLHEMEQGRARFRGETNAKEFFAMLLANAREGFLADPLYGGNKNMAGWKMIGFPGARYDFRDVIDRRGEALAYTPVSLLDPDRAA